MENLYKVLQVDPAAGQYLIEAAFHRLVLEHDTDASPTDEASSRMKKIKLAYETLSDPSKRAEYDQQLAARAAVAERRRQKKPQDTAVPYATAAVGVPLKPAARPFPRVAVFVVVAAIALVAVIVLLSRQPAPPSTSPTPAGDVRSHLDQGTALMAQGKVEQAIVEFQAAITLDPNSVEAHFRLGNVYFSQNRLDDAAGEFQKSLELDPSNIDARSNLGAVYYQRNEFEKAASEFLRALEVNPDDADIHYNLGAAYVQQAKYDAGIGEFNKALSIRPELARAYFGLGNAYKMAGSKQEAIQALEKFLSMNPSGDDAELRPHAESLLAELR